MANERNGSLLQVFLVLLVTQVCLLVAMAASAVQSRPAGRGAVIPESTPECCLYHPDCCQAATVANP
ncbi:hypothetical protein BS78_03G306000 [Paspalum vaginatum]|nr:hypothetical protein BS78_03G306000 [Paspalum vaginatum]